MPTDTNTRPGLAIAPRITSNDIQRASLCEVLDRVLNKGAVLDGEATISVAGIDLVYLGLKLMLTSIETARLGSNHAAAELASPTRIREEQADGIC